MDHQVTARNFLNYVRRDIQANPRDPKSQFVLVLFRFCQVLMANRESPRKRSLPVIVLYRLMTECILGIELRPKTRVGPGVSIFHGFGLVVNDQCVLGRDVTLRNGVTIGHKRKGGGCPQIGDGVDIGAGAIVIGEILVGDGARVGAGSVVIESVPAGAVVAGNPARIIG